MAPDSSLRGTISRTPSTCQVLYAQERRERGWVVAELKSQGVPYEERMEKLERISWPRPNSDFAFETFALFAEHHPFYTAPLPVQSGTTD